MAHAGLFGKRTKERFGIDGMGTVEEGLKSINDFEPDSD